MFAFCISFALYLSTVSKALGAESHFWRRKLSKELARKPKAKETLSIINSLFIFFGLFNRYAMAQTSTLISSFFKGKTLTRLLLLLFFCLAGAVQAYSQVATLNTSYGGPWSNIDKDKTPGWVSTKLGVDKESINMGESEAGGSASFDKKGSAIEITFDDIAGLVTFWVRSEGNRNFTGATISVFEKATGGDYTLAGDRFIQKTNTTTGEKVTFSLKPETRTVKIELLNITSGTIVVDDVHVMKAVPKINIKQGTADILSPDGRYSFGRIPVGSRSQAVVFSIENTGTADLLLTETPIIDISGVDASEFELDFTATNAVIPPGASTTFSIAFRPTKEALMSATITIANNDEEINPYIFTVTGEGWLCPETKELDVYDGIVGSQIYVHGSNFSRTSRVTVGGVDANYYVESDNLIDLQIPEGAQSGLIIVYNAVCSSQGIEFTVKQPLITISKSDISISANVGESIVEQYQVSAEFLNAGAGVSLEMSSETGVFTISKSIDGPFSSSIIINDNIIVDGEVNEEGEFINIVNRTLAPIDIWVKYTPTSAGNTTASITHETSNAETKTLNINATATVAPRKPVITISETTMNLSAAVGVTDKKLYQVSAVNLNDGASVTVDVSGALGAYTISRSENGPFTKTLVFTDEIVDNTLQSSEIWVQFAPTVAGNSTASITHESADAETKVLVINGVTPSTPLPVELISFKAVKQNDAVALTWATASEQDNNYFDVEVSEGAQAEFKAVGRVHSKVNTTSIKQNYQFRHMGSFTGTRYYRLKQVDLDGTFEYSKVVAVESRGIGMTAGVKVYPNPVTPESKLVFPAAEAGKLNVTVLNMNGSRVDSKSYDIEAGENRIELNLSSNLPAGIYILMTEFNGKTEQVKLIKQ